MKFLHLSDFHLGKVKEGVDITNSISKALDKSIDVMKNNNINLVVVTGDMFNEDATSEGKKVFKEYLEKLSSNNLQAIMIFGNHDKMENISSLDLNELRKKNIFIATSVLDVLNPIKIGDTNFYTLPWCGKKEVQSICNELKSSCSSNECFLYLFNEKLNINEEENNVLLFHTIAKKLDVNEVFKKFNYVGLGHDHHTINVNGNEKVRYAGSIIDFSALNKIHKERVFTIVDTEHFNISEIKYSI